MGTDNHSPDPFILFTKRMMIVWMMVEREREEERG